jgi:L-alanine-DL-glutamate epimerase-like enolase superfamily enzyme
MKITDVVMTTYDVGRGSEFHNAKGLPMGTRRVLSFLEVHTDEGVTGVAPTTAGPRFIDAVRAQVLGEDPMNAARIWHKTFAGWRKPVVKGDVFEAIGALDIALWDLRGRVFGQPVHRLLGGFADTVAVYATGGFYAEGKGLKELEVEVGGLVDAGYRAVKIKVGGVPLREDVARVAATREVIGADVELMIDANAAWNSAEAIRFLRAVEAYDLAWVEEPCWPDDFAGAAEVRAALHIPVAGGEREYTRWGFRDLIDRRAVDIVQADPERCGGFTEWIRIATYASAHHLAVAPHGTHLLGAPVAAAVDNGLTVESWEELFAWRKDFIEPWPVVDGRLRLPETPGLGMVVDFDALRQAAARV